MLYNHDLTNLRAYKFYISKQNHKTPGSGRIFGEGGPIHTIKFVGISQIGREYREGLGWGFIRYLPKFIFSENCKERLKLLLYSHITSWDIFLVF